MAKTVVVLGGSLGGLAVTHRLLKHTLPREDVAVVLVSKNSHFYWNPASVRAVVPGAVADADVLRPIEPGLRRYPPGSVEFVVGAVAAFDPQAWTVRVALAGGGQRAVAYDYLVVATGANAADPGMPWKANGSYDECRASLRRVAGAGPTGVELAAEIKDAFPAKTVVLLAAGCALLGGDASAGRAARELARLGVDVRTGARAVAADETLVTDLYLPTTELTPNTAFLPAAWLTPRRYVDVDERMRVRAARDVWALGDAVSRPRAGLLHTEAQGKEPQAVKGPPVDAFLCSIGRRRGAGRLGPVPVPSLLVWAVKGRTLGTERTPKYVDGSMW